jgi:hypothetical protein
MKTKLYSLLAKKFLRYIEKIFDVSGKEVALSVNKNLVAGSYQTEWNAADMSIGVYFYTLTADNYHAAKSIILKT